MVNHQIFQNQDHATTCINSSLDFIYMMGNHHYFNIKIMQLLDKLTPRFYIQDGKPSNIYKSRSRSYLHKFAPRFYIQDRNHQIFINRDHAVFR